MPVEVETSVIAETTLPADCITQLMRQRIANYIAARSDPSLYQGVRNMSQLVSDDYGNRFLARVRLPGPFHPQPPHHPPCGSVVFGLIGPDPTLSRQHGLPDRIQGRRARMATRARRLMQRSDFPFQVADS